MNKVILKNKLSLGILMTVILVFLIYNINAQVESFGTFEQNSEVTLTQTYNTSYCNVTSVSDPDSGIIAAGLMSKSGNHFNLTLNVFNTSKLGNYLVCGDCDTKSWCADFEITSTGFADTLGFYIIIILIAFILTIWGYKIEDANVTFFGGLALVGVGLYTWLNGIAGIRDTTITYITAVIIIFFGSYILIRSAMEMLEK